MLINPSILISNVVGTMLLNKLPKFVENRSKQTCRDQSTDIKNFSEIIIEGTNRQRDL